MGLLIENNLWWRWCWMSIFTVWEDAWGMQDLVGGSTCFVLIHVSVYWFEEIWFANFEWMRRDRKPRRMDSIDLDPPYSANVLVVFHDTHHGYSRGFGVIWVSFGWQVFHSHWPIDRFLLWMRCVGRREDPGRRMDGSAEALHDNGHTSNNSSFPLPTIYIVLEHVYGSPDPGNPSTSSIGRDVCCWGLPAVGRNRSYFAKSDQTVSN